MEPILFSKIFPPPQISQRKPQMSQTSPAATATSFRSGEKAMYSILISVGVIVVTILWTKRCQQRQKDREERAKAKALWAAAATEGNLHGLRSAFEVLPSFDFCSVTDNEGSTALHLAAKVGSMETVKFLLGDLSSDIRAVNVYRFTPLHSAVHFAGNYEIAKFLLEAGAPIDATDQNGWNVLHMAAAKGLQPIVEMLVDKGVDFDQTTLANHSPLLIAACNGHEDTVRYLLSKNADPRIRTKQGHETALIFACQNGHFGIAELLVKTDPELLRIATVAGTLPLHVAAQAGNVEMVQYLLDNGAEIDAKKSDGANALQVAAYLGKLDVIKALLERGIDRRATNKFGATPLHTACSRKVVEVAKLLLRAGLSVKDLDNDGLTPLHSLSSSYIEIPESQANGNSLEIELAMLLINAGADLNASDRVGGTPLHHVVCRPNNAGFLKFLLQKGANPTVIDSTEWTPLHLLCQMYPNAEYEQILREHIDKAYPDFMKSFDPKRVRLEREYIDPAVAKLTAEQRLAVLGGDVSLAGIAKLISSGRAKRIVVLTGAGISTSAGIPDFRSPEKGLYNNKELLAKHKISDGSSIFGLGQFMNDPKTFYAIAKELFLPVVRGSFKPTVCHKFISLLHKKGLLLRNYTQNIDMLERHAGLPDEALVESHGTFAKATCLQCNKQVEDMEAFWNDVESDRLPKCAACGGTRIKPNVVFFGEGLPSYFHDNQAKDFEECDLLIVMGTSLTVYPFAGLVSKPVVTCPRLLINGTAVGPFRDNDYWAPKSDGGLIKISGSKSKSIPPFRDVAFVGDIDKGVSILMGLLGWESELGQLGN